jgi:hypothetical protein
MKKFDRTFDALLVGVLDEVSGGRIERVRRFARDVVTPAVNLAPFAAARLREIADRLDPRSRRVKMRRGRRS